LGPAVDVDEHLLGAADVAHEAAEHAAGGQRVGGVCGVSIASFSEARRLKGCCVLLASRLKEDGSPPTARTMRPMTSSSSNIQRQVPIARIPWPTEGARTGTMMNVIMANDMMRAMFRPT